MRRGKRAEGDGGMAGGDEAGIEGCGGRGEARAGQEQDVERDRIGHGGGHGREPARSPRPAQPRPVAAGR